MHTRSRLAGFTLIELLVVIAIISMLAAIIMPVFGRAREMARRSSCQNNLKQIGIGIQQYVQDYDERFPRRVAGVQSDGQGADDTTQTWKVVIQPYVHSTQIFACPSNTGRESNDVSVPAFPISYVCNGLDDTSTIGGGTTPMCKGTGVNSSAIASTSLTLLVTECNPQWVFTESHFDLDGTFSGHITRVNALFADGHVKSIHPMELGYPINQINIEENTGDGDAGLTGRLLQWENLTSGN
jgi:prepilin-type N-terminal cleavage/methylation domain-containing protein/prepilin-type processing-associated H-X9-DG protein